MSNNEKHSLLKYVGANIKNSHRSVNGPAEQTRERHREAAVSSFRPAAGPTLCSLPAQALAGLEGPTLLPRSSRGSWASGQVQCALGHLLATGLHGGAPAGEP